MPVDREARLALRTQHDGPAAALAPRIGVGCDEFGRGRAVLRPRFRIERAHERDRRIDVLRRRLQQLGELLPVVARQRLEVAAHDFARDLPAWRLGSERVDLRAQAFRKVATRDAERIELLDAMTHRFDFVELHGVHVRERALQRLGFLVQVAVVVDRLDDRRADRAIAQRQRRQVELPEQMVAQILGLGFLRLRAVFVVRTRAAAVVAAIVEVAGQFEVVGLARLVFCRLLLDRFDLLGGILAVRRALALAFCALVGVC